MKTQLNKEIQTSNIVIDNKFIDNFLNELGKIKQGDNDAIKKLVKDIRNFKDSINVSNRSNEEKVFIVNGCEIILNNIFMYLNNNDVGYINAIEKEILNIKNYLNVNTNNVISNSKKVDKILEKEAEKLVASRGYGYDFAKLDELYIGLYNALNNKNKKEIIVLRGRIIRYLKKHDKKLNNVFKKLETLYFIQNILETNLNDDEKKVLITNLLNKEENKDYADYFKDSINDINLFKIKYTYICNRLEYNKIIHYIKNYKKELSCYGKNLRKDYETSFLDKKVNIGNFSKVVPEAIGISIKILANTVSEFKETDSKRKKISKLKEAFSDVGRIVSVPLVAGGKLIKEYWYTLYMLSKGVLTTKKTAKDADNENDLQVTDNKNFIRERTKIKRFPQAYDYDTLNKDKVRTISSQVDVGIDKFEELDINKTSEKENVAPKRFPQAYDYDSVVERKKWDSELNKINVTGGAYVPGVDNSIVNVEVTDIEDGSKKYIVDYDTNSRVEIVRYPNDQVANDGREYHGGIQNYREYDSDGEIIYEADFHYDEKGDFVANVVEHDGTENNYMRRTNGIYVNTNNPTVSFKWDNNTGRMVDSNQKSMIGFNNMYNNLLTSSKLESVTDIGVNSSVMNFSDGTIVSVSPEEKIITYPNGQVYCERNVGDDVERSISYATSKEVVTQFLDENGNAIKVETEENKNSEGFFSKWRWVENPMHHSNSGYYNETRYCPPGFFLPEWVADLCEEQNEYLFMEKKVK